MNTEDFTKDQLDAIKKVHELYQLKADCDAVMEWYRVNTNGLCYQTNKEMQIDNFTPRMLFNLLGMIKDGTLVYKKI